MVHYFCLFLLIYIVIERKKRDNRGITSKELFNHADKNIDGLTEIKIIVIII